MEIRCYVYGETGLTLCGVIDDFISYSFTRSYSDIGQWQLVLDGNSLNAQRIKGMDFIQSENGVAGLVQSVSESKDETYTVTYTGIELKGLANQRIIEPPNGQSHLKYTNAAPETVIAGLLTTQIITPENTGRRIANVTVAPYTTSDIKVSYEGRFQNVATEITTIANTYNIGWYADIQDGIITYHVYHGIDRTAGQNANSRMILSMENDNMQTALYERTQYIPNAVLVAGQGEGVDREIMRKGTATGFLRNELYQDARDVEQGQTAMLEQRADETLASYGDSANYETTFSASYTKYYRVDYDLGDQGTIRDDMLPTGTIDFRLTNITEIYESDVMTLNVVFGYTKNGLVDAINQSLSNTKSLLRTETANIDLNALIEQIAQTVLDNSHPIGCLYISQNPTDPSFLFGGEWERCCAGRALFGEHGFDPDFTSPGKTGGYKTHYHELPFGANDGANMTKLPWNYTADYGKNDSSPNTYALNGSAQGDAYTFKRAKTYWESNLPPYECYYIWKRIA